MQTASTYYVAESVAMRIPSSAGGISIVESDNSLECYISEFVGTFFLVLTVGFNVLQNTALAPISIGAMLMAMIFATGKVSGAHFNPAVTVGVYCRGKIEGSNALMYICSQLLGGVTAGCVYLIVLGATFNLGPGAGYGLASVCIVETLFTAALVFVVLSVATTRQDDGNWYYGLAIGFTVMAAAFAIGPISGCALNPAVTVGVMLSHFMHTGYLRISLLLLYILAPIFGAFLAVMFFSIVREQEYKWQSEECVCGNVFMSDSNFCRKCGRKRPNIFDDDNSYAGASVETADGKANFFYIGTEANLAPAYASDRSLYSTGALGRGYDLPPSSPGVGQTFDIPATGGSLRQSSPTVQFTLPRSTGSSPSYGGV